MRIVFFGTPPFAATVLDAILQSHHEIVAVVTRADKPKGRSQVLQASAVKQFVQKSCPQMPLYQPEKASTESFAQTLKEKKPDCFVVVAYGEIIKKNLLAIPTIACINTHASILPKYRGAAPIQRAIMQGEKETGVTIMEMVEKMDAGDIFSIARTPIFPDMTFGDLEKILCEKAATALLEVLGNLEEKKAQKTPQPLEGITFAPKITSEDRHINWHLPAQKIHDQIRGLSPRPGAYCEVMIKGMVKRLIIKEAKTNISLQGEPGQVLRYDRNEWVIGCGEGALSLLEVQLEGKKSLPIKEFLQGFSNTIYPISVKS